MTVPTMTWFLNSGLNTNMPFARGRNVNSVPTDKSKSTGVKFPSGGGTSSTNNSISGSSGDETIEYGLSIPSAPIVQYCPGLNVNG